MSDEELELLGPHRRRLLGLGMVVAEDVEHAVDDQQGQLVVERAGVRRRLLAGDVGTDHDIAEEDGDGIAGQPPGIAASRGNDRTSVGPGLPRCCSLSAAISARSTNVRVSSPR